MGFGNKQGGSKCILLISTWNLEETELWAGYLTCPKMQQVGDLLGQLSDVFKTSTCYFLNEETGFINSLNWAHCSELQNADKATPFPLISLSTQQILCEHRRWATHWPCCCRPSSEQDRCSPWPTRLTGIRQMIQVQWESWMAVCSCSGRYRRSLDLT